MSLEKIVYYIGVDSYSPTEQELIDMLPRALQSLKPKRSQWNCDTVVNLLILRYGLKNNNQHTLQQLGDIYGRSKETIRCIETKAFRMIRRYLSN